MNEQQFDNYFSRVKQNPPLIDIEKVHQIIAKAETKVEVKGGRRNLLKITVMTTILAVILSVVLLWHNNQEEISSSKGNTTNIEVQSENEFFKTVDEKKKSSPETDYQKNKTEVEKPDFGKTGQEPPIDSIKINSTREIAYWELDTANQKLNAIYQDSKATQNDNRPSNEEKENVKYMYPNQILDSTLFIELNREELERLGFRQKGNSIEFGCLLKKSKAFMIYCDDKLTLGLAFNENDENAVSQKDTDDHSSKSYFLAEQIEVNMNKTDSSEYGERVVPMLITNKEGGQYLKIDFQEDDLKLMFSKRFPKDFRTLLPVIIKKNTFDNLPNRDLIYWFLPSDEFFDKLPKEISRELLDEYNYVTAEDKSALVKPECKYFDECKNTLDVSNFKVFPNPANTNATVSFTLNEAVEGRILLVDIAGRERQVLQPQTSFTKGSHRIDIDVSNVPEGVYLITLYSNKGIQTQRFIVTR
jgi:hypothetical protein